MTTNEKILLVLDFTVHILLGFIAGILIGLFFSILHRVYKNLKK